MFLGDARKSKPKYYQTSHFGDTEHLVTIPFFQSATPQKKEVRFTEQAEAKLASSPRHDHQSMCYGASIASLSYVQHPQRNVHGASALLDRMLDSVEIKAQDRSPSSSDPETPFEAAFYAADAPSKCEERDSIRRLNGATVFPRRKPNLKRAMEKGCPAAAPVSITLEVLEQLASHSLPTAAAKLGISATAMKNACRKLGISRWPYFPAWARPLRTPACSSDQTDAVCMDSRTPKPLLCNAETQTDITFADVSACDQACPPPPPAAAEINMHHARPRAQPMQMPPLTYTLSGNQRYPPFAYNPHATTSTLAFSSIEAPMPLNSRETSAASFTLERRSSFKVSDFNTEWKLQGMEPRGSFSNFQMIDGFQLEEFLYGDQ